MIAELLERLRQGDRNALARLVSHAARGEHLAELQAALSSSGEPAPVRGRSEPHPARVVAFTGSGGVGKSSLIGKLLALVRGQNHRVAVLACDPQSPLSGGALLGDRFRMGSTTDDGVFIRSLAALTGHGAVADHLDVIIRLCEAFGFDVVFLETVGSGQGDVAVGNLADVVVLLLQPESGDDVQWEKAGILECADVVVVHKADLPTAEQTAAQVRAALDLSPARHAPVLRVSTKANQGHAELWQAISALPLRRRKTSAARLLFQAAGDSFEDRFREREHDPELTKLAEAWRRGDVPTTEAVRKVLQILTR
ncbi:MAG: methylmalonyl Co-A mutase-associated GTPase MeaB [Planctomycetes bacterium]|nr:methylmalonyl Co-A mutase-associated GTPase MeaB [Planctomycetota bacterium]